VVSTIPVAATFPFFFFFLSYLAPMRVSGIAGTNPAKSPNFSYTKIKLKTDTPNKTKIKKTLKKHTKKTKAN